ncbi:MAG: small basic protein [Planctomycetaceae bacterium]
MTIDRSLKRSNRLSRSRNVLKRHERIEQMKSQEKWTEDTSPIGLAKTRVIKLTIGKKKKVKKEDDAADDKKGKKKKK